MIFLAHYTQLQRALCVAGLYTELSCDWLRVFGANMRLVGPLLEAGVSQRGFDAELKPV